MPLKSGYIQNWNEDLGLPTKVGKEPNERFGGAYFWVDTDYSYHEGLRPVVRGPWCWHGRGRRFYTIAGWAPWLSLSDGGSLLGRAVSVNEDFVKIPRLEYEAIIKEKETISQSMKKLEELLSKVKV